MTRKKRISTKDLKVVRQLDLLTYFQNYEPEELIKNGRNDYKIRSHSSLHLSNGMWCYWAKNIGGVSALDYFINYNDFSEIFEELIVPHFIYKNPFDFNHKMKKIKYKSTNELKNYSIEIYNQVGITILFTKEKPETIYYTFDKMQKLNGRKIKEGFIFIVNIQDDMLSLKMAENFLRLITQSKQAKDYVIQENGDVYTKVLHHRRQFV